MLLHKPNNTVRFGQKLLVIDGQANKCKSSLGPSEGAMGHWGLVLSRDTETLDNPYYHRVPLPRIPGYYKLDNQARLADIHDIMQPQIRGTHDS